jgi:hypothetical protein
MGSNHSLTPHPQTVELSAWIDLAKGETGNAMNSSERPSSLFWRPIPAPRGSTRADCRDDSVALAGIIIAPSHMEDTYIRPAEKSMPGRFLS